MPRTCNRAVTANRSWSECLETVWFWILSNFSNYFHIYLKKRPVMDTGFTPLTSSMYKPWSYVLKYVSLWIKLINFFVNVDSGDFFSHNCGALCDTQLSGNRTTYIISFDLSLVCIISTGVSVNGRSHFPWMVFTLSLFPKKNGKVWTRPWQNELKRIFKFGSGETLVRSKENILVKKEF